MSTFKKAKVVMLPTNQQTKYLMVYSDVEKTKGKLILNGLKNDEYKEYQHLYIISDDKIKLFDCVYNNKKNIVEQINSKTQLIFVLEENKENQTFKKIIATTDTSLYIHQKETISLPERVFYLPQPSQQFIQKYIEEYNRGNIITDVLVEYLENYTLEYYESAIENKRLAQKTNIKETLKVNPKDNTITIKKAKDSYTREEVVKLLVDCCGEVSCEDGKLLGKNPEELYKWIEENL